MEPARSVKLGSAVLVESRHLVPLTLIQVLDKEPASPFLLAITALQQTYLQSLVCKDSTSQLEFVQSARSITSVWQELLLLLHALQASTLLPLDILSASLAQLAHPAQQEPHQ
jgi:hypothetical protein